MIRTDVKVKIKYTESDIKSAIAATLPISVGEIGEVQILKRALDLSGVDACYAITVGFAAGEREAGLLKMRKKVAEMPDYSLNLPKAKFESKPLVVGAGPAGLFAALLLAESGARPILIERGESVEKRAVTVGNFFSGATLNEESNIQFGEGGAGTFSDGKLKVGSLDKYKYKVLTEFHLGGGPEEILYAKGAHLGTDNLPKIIKSIREKIISLGGEVIFGARLTDVGIKDGSVRYAVYEKGGESVTLDTDTVILAIGHSARDTVRMLYGKGLVMTPKGFGIGLRIEHPREYIDELVYGKHKEEFGVGASYHLVTHLSSGRSVYSFCMCPGGEVVAATGNPEGIVTNGMSSYSRSGRNSNAALLVSMTRDDFPEGALGGIMLQEKIEKAAYAAVGNTYMAPAERLGDLMEKNHTGRLPLQSTYPIGVTPMKTEDYLPQEITESLRLGIRDFEKWMPGYAMPDATLVGPETRSTSPVRMERGEGMEALGISGLYPIGEGAGYAGGIVSSAVDGARAAEKIIAKHAE